MREILRRLLLCSGLFAAAWLWFDSPAALVSVRLPDFAAEYARKYGKRESALRTFSSRVRQLTDPGSVEEFRRRNLESRSIPAPSRDLSAWVAQLESAIKGQGPDARRVAREQVFYLPGEEPVAWFMPGISEIYTRSGWLSSYSTVAGRDLEFVYHPEPRQSAAPGWILYPRRGRAWIMALAAVMLYFLIPRKSGSKTIGYDPIPILATDFVGAAAAVFFFGLPPAVHPSNDAAVRDLLGGAGISWLVAAMVLLLLMGNARRAAFGVTLTATGLRISRLLGGRDIPFGQILAVTPIDDGVERVGIQLRLSSGETIPLRWAGLMNFDLLLDSLRCAGYDRPGSSRSPL